MSGPIFYFFAVLPYGGIDGSPDAKIGAGLAGLWTQLWRLPWSVLVGRYDRGGWDDQTELLFTLCALVNVVIHGIVMWGIYRAVIWRHARVQTS